MTRQPPADRSAGRRRWPLLLIGASAGTAVWSGWVGLGELTGFGVVRPLPGIADGLAINTAVTLPIGVEAYAMYALSIATSSRALPDRTRRYAWASSAAALLLGMAGQVAYHVMTAHQPTQQQAPGSAPWWVIALVSCLPVLVLGAASLLWHLAGQTTTEDESPRHRPKSSPESRVAAGPDSSSRVTSGPEPGPASGSEASPAASPRPARPSRPEPGPAAPAGPVPAREDDLNRVRAAIAAGDLPARPTVDAIRTQLSIGKAYARATRTQILADSAIHPPAITSPSTSLNGHEFITTSAHSEESAHPTPEQPDHITEALFADHPPSALSNNHDDLGPASQ